MYKKFFVIVFLIFNYSLAMEEVALNEAKDKEVNTENTFEKLPDELILYIISYLAETHAINPFLFVHKSRLINRRFNQLVNDQLFVKKTIEYLSNRFQTYPIHIVLVWGSKEAIGFLITNFATSYKIDLQKKEGEAWQIRHLRERFFNFLINGACKNRKDVVELILLSGIDVNETDDWNKDFALFFSSRNGDIESVEFLIKKGANANQANSYGRTALMVASGNGHKETVELLIKSGAKVNQKSKTVRFSSGSTALIDAVANNQKDIVEFLIKNGADVDQADDDGITPLMEAVNCDCVEIAQILIDNGADLNKKDRRGLTAADWAIKQESRRVAELLKNKINNFK